MCVRLPVCASPVLLSWAAASLICAAALCPHVAVFQAGYWILKLPHKEETLQLYWTFFLVGARSTSCISAADYWPSYQHPESDWLLETHLRRADRDRGTERKRKNLEFSETTEEPLYTFNSLLQNQHSRGGLCAAAVTVSGLCGMFKAGFSHHWKMRHC